MPSNNGLPANLLFPWYFSQGFGPPGGNFSSGATPGQPTNPYSGPGNFGSQPPKKSNFWMIFFIVVGILLLVCCGCGGAFAWLGYVGFNKGMEEIGNQAVANYQNDPVIQEHIGPVTKSSMNIMATGEEAQKQGQEGAAVIDVQGPKGKGQIIGVPGNGPEKEFNLKKAKLRLPDGREFPLGDSAAGGLGEMDHGHDATEAMPAGEPAEKEGKDGLEGFNGGS